MRNEQQTEECLRHSNVVYNLVGREYETKYPRPSPFGDKG
jgi:NADH dehydrogenase (ubiquinone) 1 alpha subcomplex subunit 9